MAFILDIIVEILDAQVTEAATSLDEPALNLRLELRLASLSNKIWSNYS
ncbi:MAG: hypothetical protein WC951_12610 [Bacteroidales bacterium]